MIEKNTETPMYLVPGRLTEAQRSELERDKYAIDAFSGVMFRKMQKAMTKGREGWEKCAPADLSRMLREHVEKGDPVDVANFCMMLHAMGSGISPIQPCADVEDAAIVENDDDCDLSPLVFDTNLIPTGKHVRLVRRTDMEAQVAKVRADAMRQGYLLGFNSSSEGWNREYPFKDKAQNPVEDADWLQGREDEIQAALDAGEAA